MSATDDIPEEVASVLGDVDKSLSGIEEQIKLLKNYSMEEVTQDLPPIEAAKLQMLFAYAINTLFYIYLKSQGVSPADHPVKGELERIRMYIKKIKDMTERQKAKERTLKLNVDAANRFIENAMAGEPEKAVEGSAAAASGKRKSKEGEADKDDKKKKSKRSDLPMTARSTPQPKSSHLDWKNAKGATSAEKAKAYLNEARKKKK